MSYISDLHVHLALKAANNDSIKNIWEHFENKPPEKFLFYFNILRRLALDNYYRQYSTQTQANLGSCVEGKMRLLFCTLYPIERQYIARRNTFTWLLSSITFFRKKFPFIQLWNKKRNLLTTMVQVMVGTSEKRALAIWDEQKDLDTEVDYYQDYLREFNHLKEVHDVQPEPPYDEYVFRLVGDYEELQQNQANPKVISGIVCLEGMHGLGIYKLRHLFKAKSISNLKPAERDRIMQILQLRLRELKSDPRKCPFYITFAHHYNNLLVGHAKSFKGLMKLVFKQGNGLNEGLSPEGRLIIERLLARNEDQRRILVDVKHMSIKARRRYYEMVKARNTLLADGELGVPIICSHGAVSGERTLEAAEKVSCDKKADRNAYVSRCDINICDEDILNIHDSDGLIGILMHDGRMPGKKYWDKFKEAGDDREKTRLLQQQLFLTNVYHIVAVIYQRDGSDGWGTITLGSDMDGLIDPFDDYATAKAMLAFRNHIYNYIKDYDTIPTGYRIKNLESRIDGTAEYTTAEINALNHDKSVSEIVNGIFHTHLEVFLSKYFTKEYLYGTEGVGPVV